jgi:hypothetical protein
MMRTMPAPMMMLRRTRHSRNQQHRNNRNQRQLEYVFHVKSPDSLTLGEIIEPHFFAASRKSLRPMSHREKGVHGNCRDLVRPCYRLWEYT